MAGLRTRDNWPETQRHKDTEAQRRARLKFLDLALLCASVSLCLCVYPIYRMRQMRFPPSSDTSREPSGATVTPVGRPHLLFAFGSRTNPVRKSSIAPGLPF